jgi:putative ABC transport system substrate-binding protein
MKNRFLPLVATVVAAIAVFVSQQAWSQQHEAMRRIGILIVSRPLPPGKPPPAPPDPNSPFAQGLAKHGYVEGKNLAVERRYGEYGQLPNFVRELKQLKVEVIGVWGTRGARIVQQMEKSTPIVIFSCDPYEHVKKLAHPGSNVTGTTCMTTELSPKRLELLHELLPKARRVVFFSDPEDAPEGWHLTKEAAKRLGIALQPVSYKDRDGIPEALAHVARLKPDAVFVYPDAVLFNERGQLAQFWLEHSLPTMNAFPPFAYAGGLMAYGAVMSEVFAFLGDQVGKILDGARPSDVPVERATRFPLVINMKTAKALGVEVPQSILLRADRVIE